MTADSTPQQGGSPHYKEPDWFTRHVFNRMVSGLTRLGISVWGSRVLEHRGRTTGAIHHTPVNLLTVEGTQYLVAPRGETQWVRNVRHAGGHLVLILGRRRQLCTATEVPVADSVPILRSLPAPLEVRDRDVLRRRHPRLHRRRVGRRRGPAPGIRTSLTPTAPTCDPPGLCALPVPPAAPRRWIRHTSESACIAS